jgi:adenine deaminase
MKASFRISGQIVDVVTEEIFPGEIVIENGLIHSIEKKDVSEQQYILPGLIDAHIHIESSMLVPSEFAKVAVIHGTTATVSDPHEIANVLGIKGIDYMIKNSQTVPFKFNFGAPSCVPATGFESSGAEINAEDIGNLLKREDIKYLSEMMNYPGVLFQDKEVMAKLDAAKSAKKPVDGHAPGVFGEDAEKYIAAGITTDHECFTLEEGIEKIKYGMKVQIREGSAAKNFDTLIPLMDKYSDKIMFCSDDRHPDDLVDGHMNTLIKRAIAKGYDPLTTIKVCTYNPVKHYGLDSGLLQIGDPADMVTVDDLQNFNIQSTYVNGHLVAKEGKSLIQPKTGSAVNIFTAKPISASDLNITPKSNKIRVIKAMEGQLVTEKLIMSPKISKNNVVSNVEEDVLKIVVINRYKDSKPAIGFIKGIGIKSGALASTVAHDSHNIIAVGTSDQYIVKAVNKLIETKGGIVALGENDTVHLPLPVAGLMTNANAWQVAEDYKKLNQLAQQMGSSLRAPFMTLSFMALLVIPELKLSDKGLFDGTKFCFTKLFEE